MNPTNSVHDLGQSKSDNLQLQNEGAVSFVKSWNDLMACIESKAAMMRKAG
jgi:hypothetical protein